MRLAVLPIVTAACALAAAIATPQVPGGPVLVGVRYDDAARETGRRDLQTIRSLGFNAVFTTVSWATAEPARGEYRLDDVQQLLRLSGPIGLRPRVRVIVEPPPAWAAADRGGTESYAAAFTGLVSSRVPVYRDEGEDVHVASAGSDGDLRLWGWAAVARGARAIVFHAWPNLVGADGRPNARAKVAGEFAGVITRNAALFNQLRPRAPEPGEAGIRVSGGEGQVRASFLESKDALVLIAMNYGAAPSTVTLTFAPGTKPEFWQNMETGEMVSFDTKGKSPSLTHAFAARDALVLVIRKTSPYDRGASA